MEKTEIIKNEKSSSFKNAHIFNEFAKTLQNIGADIENSVSLFDAIGEKNEVFQKLEKSITSPSIEPIIHMHDISKQEIYSFVYYNFVKTFSKNKDKFNFIHVAKINNEEVVFFISTKDQETKNLLSKTEYEYATGDLAEYLGVSFCFLDSDMENALSNTEKIELFNA
jgi:uncharacterized protein YjgD (DUF1641 family)